LTRRSAIPDAPVLNRASGGTRNRQQCDAVEYLLTENQILTEKFGKRRILLNDHQRRRLAIKGKLLGRKVLDELETVI
jgi:putative transposase